MIPGQLILVPRSDVYANMFEITVAVVTPFLSCTIESIPNPNKLDGGIIFASAH